jgi:hypothetical protein
MLMSWGGFDSEYGHTWNIFAKSWLFTHQGEGGGSGATQLNSTDVWVDKLTKLNPGEH